MGSRGWAKKMARRRLILLTGMAGSGKTTLSGIIRESGLRVITMGDVIRELANQQGLESTPENIGRLAAEIRKDGADAVARRCIVMLKNGPDGLIVVDGIRSLAEVDAFKDEFYVVLIALWASPLSRFKRLTRRGRSDDPKTWEEFKERERRELGFGIGEAIASSDYLIKNDDGISGLKPAFDEILEKMGNG
ncbi:MAG: AAA family ATPase [Candidatus Bathyarchaeota archaeon]|nr:AAA family ATPase [Candidatus Bathyarchaeota archaeon]